MIQHAKIGPWLRWLVLAMFVAILWASVAGSSSADEPNAVKDVPTDDVNFAVRLLKCIFTWPPDMKGILEVLRTPGFTVAAIIAVNIIVFVETGLLIGFFLPGDSLLVTAGIACEYAHWPLPLLVVTVCLSAIIGDSVGYSIGYKTGPKIFNREKSFFFKKDHLLAAQHFYEKHGGKTIVLARFMPFIRTFAPVVAGVGRMDYRRFLFYNVFGGVGWVVSMILIGYFLKAVIEPPFKVMFGPQFDLHNHIEKVIYVVVFLSIAPGIFLWMKKKLQGSAVAGGETPGEPRPLGSDSFAGEALPNGRGS